MRRATIHHAAKKRKSYHYLILVGIAVIWDGLIVIPALIVLFVLVTGGSAFQVGEHIRISARSIVNPLAALSALLLLRFTCFGSIPFFNISSLSFTRLADCALAAVDSLVRKISGIEPRTVKRIVFWTIALSVLLKMTIAYVNFGFFSGDDVEIQEMSFARLFHWDWQAWELRNPLFPMVFIYPVQFVLKLIGVEAAWPLIYAGRLIVIAFSALNLWLVYRIASRLYGHPAVGLMSLFFLALSKLHTTFASSELPRTVASTFILLGFWFLLSKTKEVWATILSGCALGLAAALRFSEILYIGPAFLFLFLKKRRRQAFWVGIVSAAAFVLAIGISDALYWKAPFFSLKNIVDYTLVKKLSSRGYEPFHYYLASIGLWTDFFTFALALYALKLSNKKIYIWAFSPVILLSFLPHKEPRYLLPAIPFWAIMAGLSAWHLMEKGRDRGFSLKASLRVRRILLILGSIFVFLLLLAHKDYRYATLALPLLAVMAGMYYFSKKRAEKREEEPATVLTPAKSVLLFLSLAFLAFIVEVDGFHFRRSESGVEMGRYLARLSGFRVLAIEDYWRAGGRLYFVNNPVLINLDSTRLAEPDYLRQTILENEAQAVGIRDEHVREFGCKAILESLAFQEVRFSDKKRKETYRLFLRFPKAAYSSPLRNGIPSLFQNLIDDRQKSSRGHFGFVRAFSASQPFVKAAQVKIRPDRQQDRFHRRPPQPAIPGSDDFAMIGLVPQAVCRGDDPGIGMKMGRIGEPAEICDLHRQPGRIGTFQTQGWSGRAALPGFFHKASRQAPSTHGFSSLNSDRS